MKRFKLLRQPKLPTLPGFDPVYYLFWYADVRSYGGSPLQHYLLHGWKEGRDPSAGFSTSGYLQENADVAREGLNPLVHFVKHGLAEGRKGFAKDPTARPPAPSNPLQLLSPPEDSLSSVDEYDNRMGRAEAEFLLSTIRRIIDQELARRDNEKEERTRGQTP